jgi:hypothetical protein
VDISAKEQRAIVIDGLRDAMDFFATNHVWDEINQENP